MAAEIGRTAGTGTGRTRDPERTRANILDEATAEFCEQGYGGARVDAIAERTATTKRMIYYYFGDKKGLYVAALERAYARMREREKQIDLDHLDPVEAIRALAEISFDHQDEHREIVQLVAVENAMRGENVRGSALLRGLNTTAVDILAEILARGRAAGVFREGQDALDVHMLISSFCQFRVANRYTFDAIFGRDMTAPEHRARLRTMLGDVVVAYLTTPA